VSEKIILNPQPLSALTQLRRQMTACLNLGKLQLLCFDLGVNLDELPSQALSPKINSWLRLIGHEQRWPDRITALTHTCPKMEWPPAAELKKAAVTQPFFAGGSGSGERESIPAP
jgi:hypothetical protein